MFETKNLWFVSSKFRRKKQKFACGLCYIFDKLCFFYRFLGIAPKHDFCRKAELKSKYLVNLEQNENSEN